MKDNQNMVREGLRFLINTLSKNTGNDYEEVLRDPASLFMLHIAYSEGLYLKPYRCTAGYLTVGWGLNLDVNPLDGYADQHDVRLTVEQATFLLSLKTTEIAGTMERHFDFLNAKMDSDEVRAYAIMDMVYNMGATRVLGFKKMLLAAKRGDWWGAAMEAADSKYFLETGDRPERVVYMLMNNRYCPSFLQYLRGVL